MQKIEIKVCLETAFQNELLILNKPPRTVYKPLPTLTLCITCLYCIAGYIGQIGNTIDNVPATVPTIFVVFSKFKEICYD